LIIQNELTPCSALTQQPVQENKSVLRLHLSIEYLSTQLTHFAITFHCRNPEAIELNHRRISLHL
jgi:hypothetical protein